MSFTIISNGILKVMSCLTKAFFEIAQANRDKSASGGSRIGEAGYDQRMQAARRMSIT